MNRLFLILGTILVFMLLIGVSSIAEEITLTTYYPAPYGVYNELTTTGNTYLATTSGNVGIGTTTPSGGKLHMVVPTTGTGTGIRVTNNQTSGVLSYGVFSEIMSYESSALCGFNSATVAGGIGVYGYSANGVGVVAQGSQYSIMILGSGPAVFLSGNVGIGTTSPEATLDVNGDIKAVLPNIMGGSPMEYILGQRTIGYDIAELFEANEEVESGDVLSIDENGNLKKSTEAYDFKVAGIVSEAPAILFEGNQLHIAPQPFEFKGGRKPPLALAGRVRCKVTTQDGGPIKAVDLLTSSSIPGHAMKATKPGPIVGKALESLESGTGKIMVLVNLGWYGRTE